LGDGGAHHWARRIVTTLRTQREQEVIEGRESLVNWSADDYAVANGDIRIGRIYRAQLATGE
jgi:hypothetical protein